MFISPEIAEICGIHAGDGYLRDDGKRREWDISGSIEEKGYYDEYIIPLINKLFDIQIKGKFFQSRGTYGFVIRNPEVIKFIHKLGFPYGNKSTTVKIPSIISESEALKRSFLRGYFDTDGCLAFSKKYGKTYCEFKKTRHCYPSIQLATVSESLAKDLKKVLGDLGFNFVFYKYKPKYQNNNLKYNFNINGSKNLNKWLVLIGTNNHIKYSRFLIWDRYGFCPTNTTYQQRLSILKGSLDPNIFIHGPIA